MAYIFKDLLHTAAQIDQSIDDLASHIANGVIHITAAEREAWDAKASASDIQSLQQQINGKAASSDLTAETTAREKADDVHDLLLSELLDGKPKNISHFMHDGGTWYKITFTPNKATGELTIQTDGSSNGYKGFRILGTNADSVGWEYGIPIPKGKYKLTGLPAGSSSSTFRYLLGIAPSSSDTRSSTSVYEDYEFEITTDTARIDLSAYVAQNANISTAVILKPMICRKEAYSISPDFVPWHPPLADMWAAIQALQV